MDNNNCCKNCRNSLSSSIYEFCEDCRKNHNLSVFLKDLLDYLGNDVSFDENDFVRMGIDEFRGYEYLWDLSKLNLVNLYNGKYFIDKKLINDFIEQHFISQYCDSDDESLIKIGDEYYEVYDSSKVKITSNPNLYKRDILNLVKHVNFIEESPNIPFPQSDDLNRFIFIGQHLLKRDWTKEEIKQLNKIGNRIVNMYTSTGFYFQVFEKYKKDKTIFYKLSNKGKEIFSLDEYDRNLRICSCILEHEIFHRIFLLCFFKKKINKKDIVEIMLQYDLNMDSMVTIKRRAGCVSSWMHWIFRLMGIHI